MKFKKENKVEVWRKSKEQMGSWFPGSITFADGDEYIVKYEHFLNLKGEPVVEKVCKEDVRPQPPETKEEKWMDSNITEVFDINCWRTGKVVKVLKNSRVVVKLSGSIQLKEFHQSSLRIRQAWKNNKWVVIGKIADGENRRSTHDTPKHALGLGGYALGGGHKDYSSRDKEGHEHIDTVHYMRTSKRNPSCYYNDDPTESGSKKRKVTIEAGCCDGLPQRTHRFSQHVDAVPLAKSNISKCKLNYSSKCTEMEKSSKYSAKPFPMPTRITEDSDGCSVASCSGNDLPGYRFQTAWKSLKDGSDSSCDDAESLCPSASLRKFLPAEDGLKANVRELELHAYRRTLQALYASGPLSWEQESLLTNLRISLHISNEEHLLLLRQLLSAQEY